jgi:hypothetical protein
MYVRKWKALYSFVLLTLAGNRLATGFPIILLKRRGGGEITMEKFSVERLYAP